MSVSVFDQIRANAVKNNWLKQSCLVQERIANCPVIITYENLIEKVDHVSQKLASIYGLKKLPVSPRVAVISTISIETILLLLAIPESGGIVVPISESESKCSDKFDYKLDIPLSALFSPSEVCKTEIVKVDVFMILSTSGSTSGFGKQIPLTHSNVLASIANIREAIDISSSDICFCVMPLFHIHGIVAVVLTTLLSGGTVVLPRDGKFSASRFWSVMAKFQCTWYSASPAIHAIVMQNWVEVPSLRFVRSSSSELKPELRREMEEKLHVSVFEAYGMTEAAHQIAATTARNKGMRAIGSVKIKIEDGEILIKGPNVFDNSDSYFKTGDLGEVDIDGNLRVTGRIKDIINRGGEKINPIEIDNALNSHPLIQQAVAFHIPHKVYGETVAAAVVMEQPEFNETDMAAQIKESLGQQGLPKFKIPEHIFFRTALPETATKKIQRSLVAKACLESGSISA